MGKLNSEGMKLIGWIFLFLGVVLFGTSIMLGGIVTLIGFVFVGYAKFSSHDYSSGIVHSEKHGQHTTNVIVRPIVQEHYNKLYHQDFRDMPNPDFFKI